MINKLHSKAETNERKRINKLQSKKKEKRKLIKIVKYRYLMKQSLRDRYRYRDGETKNKEEKNPRL